MLIFVCKLVGTTTYEEVILAEITLIVTVSVALFPALSDAIILSSCVDAVNLLAGTTNLL